MAILLFPNLGTSAVPVLDDPSKVMVIDGPITGQSIAPLKQALLQELADGKVRPELQLIINSPGGSVFAGFQFLSIMKAAKAEGMRVVCIVPGLAASMAFQILTQCDERHVLNESMLLWHRARVMGINGPMTAPQAEHLGRQLQETDDSIMDQLAAALSSMTRDAIVYHFERESFHGGSALCNKTAPGFCTSHDVIPNLFYMINNPKVVHSAEPSFLDKLFRKGELIHVAPNFFN
jgi:ATP-dependent protease ClpP protease subunit